MFCLHGQLLQTQKIDDIQKKSDYDEYAICTSLIEKFSVYEIPGIVRT